MQHLEQERLAALDHDAATADELAHLAACVACRMERDAFAALAVMAADVGLGSSDPEAPRLTSWDRLSAGLRTEGLIRGSVDITPQATPRAALPPAVPRAVTGGAPVRASRRFAASRVFRIAATVAAVAGAGAIGRLSARPGLAAFVGGAEAGASAATSNASVAQALRSTSFGGAEAFASVGEATASLMRAQQEYERASLWLAGNDTTTRSSDVYRARLAALDQMMAASRAALRDAPQDPVLNHYFLAAYNAREATLQQLSGALPVDMTIESY